MWNSYKNVLLKYSLMTKSITSCCIMSLSDITCQQTERHQISSNKLHQQRQHRDFSTCYNYNMSSCEANNDATNNNNNTANIDTHTTATKHNHNHDSQEKLVQQKQDQFDWTRTIHVGITGLVCTGPLSHTWYKVLELVVGTTTRHQYHVGIILRMILDAAIFSPVAIGGYFTCRSMLEIVQEDYEQFPHNYNNTYATTSITNKLQEKWYTTLYASWKFWPLANIMYVLDRSILSGRVCSCVCSWVHTYVVL